MSTDIQHSPAPQLPQRPRWWEVVARLTPTLRLVCDVGIAVLKLLGWSDR